MAEPGAAAIDPKAVRNPALQRRLWGLRLVVVAATAAALGIPQQQLSQSQAAGTVASLAARQNVSLARVRSVALAAADPVLDEAMRAGVISDAERRSLRWRIREGGVV
jgi:hypothetical protein